MASKAELNRIAASHDTLFGKSVPAPLVDTNPDIYNPLRRAIQKKFTLNQSKKQLYEGLIASGKLSQEKYDKYLKLVSNNDDTLSNSEKAALKPYNVNSIAFKPRAPKTRRLLKPHPPSRPNPKRQMKLKNYLKGLGAENATRSSNNSDKPKKNSTGKTRFNMNVNLMAKNTEASDSNNNSRSVAPQRSNRSTSSEPANP